MSVSAKMPKRMALSVMVVSYFNQKKYAMLTATRTCSLTDPFATF
jgi:hypothetical protein